MYKVVDQEAENQELRLRLYLEMEPLIKQWRNLARKYKTSSRIYIIFK